MADRSSAGLFGAIFKYLAQNPDERAKTFARRLWKMTDEYDFTPDQMCADKALRELGLLRDGVDPEWPEDGVTKLYGPRRRHD